MSRKVESKKSLTLSAEDTLVRSTKTGKLLFTNWQGKTCAALIRDDRLTVLHFPDTSKVGTIYLARVKNVVPNIKACFVEITHGELCFLPLKDAAQNFLLNRKPDGRILEGDEFPVMIVRDAQKTKQASVTAQLSYADDYFALSFGSTAVGISSKLNEVQRQQLETLLTKNGIQQEHQFVQSLVTEAFDKNIPLPQLGLIVRTKAAEFYEQPDAGVTLVTAFKTFLKGFTNFLSSFIHRTAPCCVQKKDSLLNGLFQLIYPNEFSEVVTDLPALYPQLQDYFFQHQPQLSLRLYDDPMLSLTKLYSLDSKIGEALSERVWLKSGGYLVIQPTEALTVIDVNSGKYEKKGTDAEAAARRINLEAAAETARQLRLRNLSGIILIDFINMRTEENRAEVMRSLRDHVRADRIKTTVVDMTPLGLVEMTRKKVTKPIYGSLKLS